MLERYRVDRLEEGIIFREIKNGGCLYKAMGYGDRKERPGFLSHPLRKRPPALCGGAGAAVRLWRRKVSGRGSGVLAANHRARVFRARCIAP